MNSDLIVEGLDNGVNHKYETLNDRIARLEEKTGMAFPSHLFYNSLFIDEASIGFSKTHIEEFTHYPNCLKAIGIGIGKLVVKDERNEDGSNQELSYGIDLLEWEGVISYEKGKKPHWDILTKMFIPHMQRIIDEHRKKPDVYICTQSKYYVDKNYVSKRVTDFIEINGAKNDGTYEQELKEWTGKEVKMRLWANLDEDTINSIMDKKRKPIDRLFSIRDNDFLPSCFLECEGYLIRT